MAEIRCPNCGRENPDFLDVCQFCQTPLITDPLLHIGEEPTKKDTGELEQILPDWLKEVRQQGMEEAQEDALRPQSRSKVTEEPPDLLAGLMSQAESDEEELPDWLAGIAPSLKKEEPPSPPPPAAPAPAPAEPSPAEELPSWFSQEAEQPAPPFLDETPAQDDWMKDLTAFTAEESKPAQEEPEDLSWLRELEAASKGVEEPAAPKPEDTFLPSASEEDLDWLNKLGAASAPVSEEPAPAQPSAEEDLSWLDKLGGGRFFGDRSRGGAQFVQPVE
ncbi:MAG: zinc ribbon domain-containing protein, partial [Chloroflexota bacterium]